MTQVETSVPARTPRAQWGDGASASLPAGCATPPRQRRGHRRQQALIDAGLLLTQTRDWDDVTIADIAAAIDCSVGTFYTRFHTKDAYFDALLSLMVDAMLQRAKAFHSAPERRDESASELVAGWVGMAVESFRAHRGLYATALLNLRRLAPEARAASPLLRLRDRGNALFLSAMKRHPGWSGAAARADLLYAQQIQRGALLNAALTDGGPLHLDDAEFAVQLTRLLCGFLGITPPPGARPRKAAAARRAQPAKRSTGDT